MKVISPSIGLALAMLVGCSAANKPNVAAFNNECSRVRNAVATNWQMEDADPVNTKGYNWHASWNYVAEGTRTNIMAELGKQVPSGYERQHASDASISYARVLDGETYYLSYRLVPQGRIWRVTISLQLLPN